MKIGRVNGFFGLPKTTFNPPFLNFYQKKSVITEGASNVFLIRNLAIEMAKKIPLKQSNVLIFSSLQNY
jgi:hypothetical protein